MTDYPIGTVFMSHGSRKSRALPCTVTDIYKTYNSAGELVHTRYVAAHEFLGMPIVDRDVCAATIARGLITESAA